MYEVYRDRDSSKVGLFNELLKSEGIPTILRNWNASNILEIPIPDLFPAVCVINKDDIELARQIIYDYIHADNSKLPSWKCPKCGVEVDGGYAECWKCQEPIPKQASNNPEL